MADLKVAVLPCNGVGRLVSTVVRQAGYRIAELRPDDVVILSSPAVIVDLAEFTQYLDRYPILAINGCAPRCASGILERKGKKASVTIDVADVAAEGKISIAGESRVELNDKGFRLVEAIAERAVEEIDRILGKEKSVSRQNTQASKEERDLSEEILSRL